VATEHSNLSDYNLEHITDAEGFRIGIVVSEWNNKITDNLLKGAKETLIESGVIDNNLVVRRVPGTYELPLGAQFLLDYEDLDAVISIGCVIQGQTKHFDFVCEATAQGIKDVSLKYNKPVIFCVLTDNNIEQSEARSGGDLGNKGVEAAVAALKMIVLQRGL